MRTLITGGVKSGKSHHALEIARADFTFPAFFIATAEIFDDEMRERVQRHRAERNSANGGLDFITIEEPIELGKAVREASPVVVDCIPMWVNNLMHYSRDAEFETILTDFILNLGEHCIVVTNETGLGNIPFDEETRRYNRLLAEANRRLASAFDRVELMVAGIPLRIK